MGDLLAHIITCIITYLKWIIDPQNINANIFTLISVVLSGLVSWIISAIYFTIGNRNNLKTSILFPMRSVLNDDPTWAKYRELTEYLKDYSSKYLRKNERSIIDRLLLKYKDICKYNYESVCAESLQQYFVFKLKQHGINTKPVPIIIEDEIVDYGFPPDMLYFVDDIAKCINIYPPEYDEEDCKKAVVKLFRHYAKTCFTSEDIMFFDDVSMHEVLHKAKNRIVWDQRIADYQASKKAFLEMKSLQ